VWGDEEDIHISRSRRRGYEEVVKEDVEEDGGGI